MKIKQIKGWAGIAYGRIDTVKGVKYGYETEPNLRAVFKSKKEALDRYTEVIPVIITPNLIK